ncbi:uncharacterized protein LOC130690252 [Daphnia carinata]|uniref:uncharacterized protein LOC130690252 n=1 Tax=Daphnia carinata TaxID=120202 RepID=UPI0025802BD9|nr:uncharacterized protein LOC130690252 [Daphnia carinata]
MTAMPRKIATGYSQIFGLVWLVLFLLISYGHATGFFCPNGEQYERHLNELLNDNDFIFSGTVGNVTDDGRFIVIRIKSLFKGVWKNPDITLLANQPFESSSLSFIPLSDTKKDTTRWLLPQRSQVGCFAYGPTELRQRDSRVFFARVYGFSVLLQTHIQLTKFILMKLRILTLTVDHLATGSGGCLLRNMMNWQYRKTTRDEIL